MNNNEDVVLNVSSLLLSSARTLCDRGEITETQYAVMLSRSREIDAEPAFITSKFVEDAKKNSEFMRQILIDRGIL